MVNKENNQEKANAEFNLESDQKTDLTELFEQLKQEYQHNLQNNCRLQISEARNKAVVMDALKNELGVQLVCYSRGVSKNIKAYLYFTEHYARGKEIEKILGHIEKGFQEALNAAPIFDPREEAELTPLSATEKALLNQFPEKYRGLITLYIQYDVIQVVIKELTDIPAKNKLTPDIKLKAATIKWPGSKDNKNEFVQLMYALHQAGLFNNGEGEITKTVEELTDLLNVNLGKNWQSNHSASIHKVNNSYKPQIFDEIREAYRRYAEGR